MTEPSLTNLSNDKQKRPYTRVIPKVSGLDILNNNMFHNLYISETYILYEL